MQHEDGVSSGVRPRASALVGSALLLGLASSAAMAALRSSPFGRPGSVFLPFWEHALPRALLLAAAGVAAGGLVHRALASHQPARRRAFLAVLLALVVAASEPVLLANRRLLPELWRIESLAANAAVGLALLALAWLVTRLPAQAQVPRPRTAGALALLGMAGTGTVHVVAWRDRPPGPHVFVLLVDVLRADHLGCYGYERATSPEIDRLAGDAVLFEQAVSQSTFTKTSVASLLTGLNPHRHGVYTGDLADREGRITSDVLEQELVTLPEELRERGFTTLGLVQNDQLRAYMGFGQGFDLYLDRAGNLPRIAGDLRELVRGLGERRRLFAYVHILDLHGPYRPGPAYATRFGRFSDRYDDMDLEAWRSHFMAVRRGREALSPNDVEELRTLYDGQLCFVDEWVGRILSDLRAAGLYDPSVIVFTADHGDAFLEHGQISHSSTPYQELVHVPLILKLPGSRHAGLRVADPVGLVDLLPTLLEVAGGGSFDPRDGASLLARIEGEDGFAQRVYVSEYDRSVAVRAGDWKLIDEPGGFGRALYDLARDPGETQDQQAAHPDVATRLGRHAQAVRALRREIDPRSRVVLDEETLAELRALGYL